MRKIIKIMCSLCIAAMILTTSAYQQPYDNAASIVYAHSGRTDSRGGHRDNKNKSGLGSYHYHCGGHPAHLHENGKCPYDSSSSKTESSSSKSKSSTKSVKKTSKNSKSTIMKVQEKLNELGYNCGEVDGKVGKKTKKALKDFQRDNGLTVDGIIGKQVKKALNI